MPYDPIAMQNGLLQCLEWSIFDGFQFDWYEMEQVLFVRGIVKKGKFVDENNKPVKIVHGYRIKYEDTTSPADHVNKMEARLIMDIKNNAPGVEGIKMQSTYTQSLPPAQNVKFAIEWDNTDGTKTFLYGTAMQSKVDVETEMLSDEVSISESLQNVVLSPTYMHNLMAEFKNIKWSMEIEDPNAADANS